MNRRQLIRKLIDTAQAELGNYRDPKIVQIASAPRGFRCLLLNDALNHHPRPIKLLRNQLGLDDDDVGTSPMQLAQMIEDSEFDHLVTVADVASFALVRWPTGFRYFEPIVAGEDQFYVPDLDTRAITLHLLSPGQVVTDEIRQNCRRRVYLNLAGNSFCDDHNDEIYQALLERFGAST